MNAGDAGAVEIGEASAARQEEEDDGALSHMWRLVVRWLRGAGERTRAREHTYYFGEEALRSSFADGVGGRRLDRFEVRLRTARQMRAYARGRALLAESEQRGERPTIVALQ
jgi:hypothetical protein